MHLGISPGESRKTAGYPQMSDAIISNLFDSLSGLVLMLLLTALGATFGVLAAASFWSLKPPSKNYLQSNLLDDYVN